MTTQKHLFFGYGIFREELWGDKPYGQGQRWKGYVTTAAGYIILQLTRGGLAYMCRTNGPTRVYGSLWEVDDSELNRIDAIEGIPHHYQREEITLRGGKKAFAYTKNSLLIDRKAMQPYTKLKEGEFDSMYPPEKTGYIYGWTNGDVAIYEPEVHFTD